MGLRPVIRYRGGMQLIRDQRSMSGEHVLHTAEQVRDYWARWGQTRGFIRQGRRATGEPVDTGLRLPAYVNHGRWVADCPVCGSGIAGWPDHEQGCCLNCGCVFRLDYPSAREIAEAEAALAARPDESVRNWRPDQGETPRDLRHENIRRGYQPADETAGVAQPPSRLTDLLNTQLAGAGDAQATLDLLRRHGVI